MRPDIVFVRRDVQIADQNAFAFRRQVLGPSRRLFEEIQLVGELFIDLRIGLVTTGRHVEIV